jgi:hypothetical protein
MMPAATPQAHGRSMTVSKDPADQKTEPQSTGTAAGAQAADEAAGSPDLQCCAGRPAPPEVAQGWQAYLKFTDEAQQGFWSVLHPALTDPTNPGNRDRVQLFCNDHGVPLADVVAAVRACEFLFRGAATLNLDDQTFESDLVALSGGGRQAARPLMTRYAAAKSAVRNGIISGTIADHGKLAVSVSWRTDVIGASQRGMRLGVPVIFLTLNYVEGEKKERISLQLTPDALRQLKQFCAQMDS